MRTPLIAATPLKAGFLRMTSPVDVLIVGAGASGAAAAWSLAETKMHILLLGAPKPRGNPQFY
jgi:ribulose 1,5-bisphosphate synthetase/thiazole synthase